MRYPEFLKPGGMIGFVAPSFGCATEPYSSAFAAAQVKFRKMGYGLQFGPNCTLSEGIGISNTPQKCGAELNAMYQDAGNDILIACGGGEMMCEVVPFIDFGGVGRAKPKWYLGYSDNTNFTFTSATLADTAAVYGPCVGDFGMEPWHPALDDVWGLNKGQKSKFQNYDKWELDKNRELPPTTPYQLTEPTVMKVFGAGEGQEISFEGRLIGGCMDCLENLIGTPYDQVREFNERYASDGIIWFLEACELNVFSIRRTIWHMKSAGWFSHVKGFLIGRPGFYGEELIGLDQYHAFADLLAEYQVPILMDLDIGHHPPMIPMVSGGYARVNFLENHFSVEYLWK